MPHSLRRASDSGGRVLQRILDTPHLAQAVPRLPPELLHRVIQHHGLEDCAELVALATPAQLARVFDLDLWQPSQPGVDEQFDAGRFGVWLYVLVEGGAGVAAAKIAEMSPEVIVAGLAQHVRVFDPGTAMAFTPLDGDQAGGREDAAFTSNVGGYRVVARRTEAWDAIVEVLVTLAAGHGDCFHRLMKGCRALSDSRPERSGMHDLLDHPEQAMFDLAVDRESRRERQGYVPPAQARAFLAGARRPSKPGAAAAPDPIAQAYFRALDEQMHDAHQARAALAPGAGGSDEPPATSEGVAGIVDLLFDSGLLAPPARALPAGSDAEAAPLWRILAALEFVSARDPGLHARRIGEVGFLANTLVSGCTIQSRPFTPQEASDAAIATCNLGLDNWPAAVPEDVLVTHDLVALFRIGWAVLYERVSLAAARGLIDALARIMRSRDRELQIELTRLRIDLGRQVKAGTPWRARAGLEVLTTLDLPAWAVLGGLLDECPVIHAAIGASRGTRPHTVSPTAFEFVANNAQLASVDEFLAALPDVLTR